MVIRKSIKTTDPILLLPFTEWSDDELNAEKWETDKLQEYYEDAQTVHLPYNIVSHEWKRPSQLFPDFTIYRENSIYPPDLINGSKHLLHSEFVRNFISSIIMLWYLGNTKQYQCEMFGKFIPNTGEGPWRPWHHIYSKCGAGKGTKHGPLVNQYGKYIVRLFWMGCWRRIYIDDRIPLDKLQHLLLPMLELTNNDDGIELQTNNNIKLKKDLKQQQQMKCIELWPLLLSKALLKIASLTAYEDKEIVDFDIVHCLTGFIPQKINTKELNIYDIWDICSANTNHYNWPINENKQKHGGSSKKSKKSDKSSKGKSTKGLNVEKITTVPNFLVGHCKNLRKSNETVPDLSACWSHYLLIDQIRDIPLIQPPEQPDLPLWKQFRWKNWAIEQGLIESNEPTGKYYKILSAFRKISDHVIYKQPLKVPKIKQKVKPVEEKKKNDSEKRSKSSKEKSSKKSSNKGGKSSKKSVKSSKSSKKSKKTSKEPQFYDPTIWIDFEKISGQLDEIIIYFKPSRFETNYKITNLTMDTLNNVIYTPLNESGNETIYAFIDSIDCKRILFNLSQTGNTFVSNEDINTSSTSSKETMIEDDDCLTRILYNRVKNYYKKPINNEENPASPVTSEDILIKLNHKKIYNKSHIVVENYDWYKIENGEMLTSLNTYGTKTILLELKPGRYILKILICTKNAFILNINSDTNMIVGNLETILNCMCNESQCLTNLCFNISNAFGRLVQCFGMPEFSMALKNFHNSYKPSVVEQQLVGKENEIVHNTFYETLLLNNNANNNKDVKRAIRILLLKFNLQHCNTSSGKYKEENDCMNIEDISEQDQIYMKLMNNAAIKIQGFFRGIYTRLLYKYHQLSHKEYMNIFNTLKTVYMEWFSEKNCLIILPMLIRQFLSTENMLNICRKYEFYNDLKSVIKLNCFNGNVNCIKDEWTIICRYLLHLNTFKDITIKIDLFSNDLQQYFLRVFNNDTKEEIKFHLNKVCCYKYPSNRNGYTILCYGMSNINKTIPWKMYFVCEKEYNNNTNNTVIIDEMDLKECQHCIQYIPNRRNILFKYLIYLKSDCLLSVRLSASSKHANIILKLFNDKQISLLEVCGSWTIFIPAILIEFNKKHERNSIIMNRSIENCIKKPGIILDDGSNGSNKSTKRSSFTNTNIQDVYKIEENEENNMSVYILEGFVVENTWPLTDDEWKNVEMCKMEQFSYTESVFNFSKFQQQQKSVISNKRPFCTLEIICNNNDDVEIKKDQTNINEINKIKQKWYENEPERYKKSKQIRDEYLLANRKSYDSLMLSSINSAITMEMNSTMDYYNGCEEDERIRNLFPSNNLLNQLKSFDFTLFYTTNEIDEDKRKVKSCEEMQKIDKFNENFFEYQQNMMSMCLKLQMDQFNTLNDWFDVCRQQSDELLKDALRKRERY